MKYVKEARQFTTNEFSIQEIITEIKDMLWIAEAQLPNIPEVQSSKNLLKQIDEDYIKHLKHKVEVVLKHVPEDVQEKEKL